MKAGYSGARTHPPLRWARAYAGAALVLTGVLVVVLTTALFTAAGSRADGPPTLGPAFTLPFNLEQGRPAPSRNPSGQRLASTPVPTQQASTPAPQQEDSTPEPEQEDSTPQQQQVITDELTATAKAIGFSVIEIHWTGPDGDVNAYQLQVSSDDSSWEILAGTGELTDSFGNPRLSFQHYGLEANQTRYYRLRARIGTDWDPWTSSVSATTYPTSAPTLEVEAAGTTSLELSWGYPHTISQITDWVIHTSESLPSSEDDEAWKLLATVSADVHSYTHRNLPTATTRYYRVRALSGPRDDDKGSWSRTRKATTFDTSVPSAPSLSARASGSSEILLTWSKPSGRGYPITGYDLQQSPNGNNWEDIGPYSPEDSRVNLGVENPGTERYFRIRANNSKGKGRWSGAVRGVSENGGAGKPGNLATADFRANWVEVTWEAPVPGEGDPPITITGYQVQRRDHSEQDGTWSETWQNVGSTGPTTLAFKNTGLKPSTQYHYRVAARDKGGLGKWAEVGGHVTTMALPPGAPRLTAQAMCHLVVKGPNIPCVTAPPPDYVPSSRPFVWIEMGWTVPASNGAIITDYQVDRSPNGRDGWELLSNLFIDPSGTEDHKVDYGERWYYRVRAVWSHSSISAGAIANGEEAHYNHGPWSSVTSAVVRTFVPAGTGVPLVNSESSNQFTISWPAPKDDGGRPITGYQLQVAISDGESDPSWTNLASPGAASRTYTHSGLSPDTSYCYRVRARNSLGWGRWTYSVPSCYRLE